MQASIYGMRFVTGAPLGMVLTVMARDQRHTGTALKMGLACHSCAGEGVAPEVALAMLIENLNRMSLAGAVPPFDWSHSYLHQVRPSHVLRGV